MMDSCSQASLAIQSGHREECLTWSTDPAAQTARQTAQQWCSVPTPLSPSDEGADSEVMTPGSALLYNSSFGSSVMRLPDPAASASVVMVESQASQVVEILSEIAEMSRAQRRSAAELKEERRSLAIREAAMRAECEEAQSLMQRLQAEVVQRKSASFEAESLSAELDEERQRSHAQRQAARKMRQRYERKLQEQAEELRRVLQNAEYREEVQEAAISDLQMRLRLVGETEERSAAHEAAEPLAAQDAHIEPPPLVFEAPLQDGSLPSALESTRRRLFSPTMVLTPTSTTGEMAQGVFESTIEQSASTGSLLATSNLEPLTVVAQDHAEASAAETCGTLQQAALQESPPIGMVAEKVSIFEQRCHTPTQGAVPAALRRGPRSAPVPTPFGSTRIWREEGRLDDPEFTKRQGAIQGGQPDPGGWQGTGERAKEEAAFRTPAFIN
uniref:Uncharacterized protein n=1 Tax=Alexandrium monilatum TaxID=311494 RepID=A0A7S4PYV7_9DINO